MNRMFSVLPLCTAVLLSACGGGGGSGDVGNQVPNTSTPTTNDLSPSGKVVVDGSGGKRVVVKSTAMGSGGPISSHQWSVSRAINQDSIPLPVLENANCVNAIHAFENNIARSSCEVTAIIPQVSLNTTWILSNKASAPSGDNSASVVIEAQPSLSGGGAGVRIDDANTTPSVGSESTVRVACTARIAPGLPSPVVAWSFGALVVNGQPYAINPKSVVTQAEDGSVTNTLTIDAPAVTAAASMPMTCTASDPMSASKVSKDFTLSVFPTLSVPFNLLGGQVVVGSSGRSVSLPVSVQDPTGQVTISTAYVRWSQISGPSSIIGSGTYRYGTPLTFVAPVNTDANNAHRYVFQAEASSTPWVAGMSVPDSQKAQVTFLNYPSAQPLSVSIDASQSVYTTSTVTLASNVSADNGVKITGYAWSFVSVPSGSTAQLLNATQANTSFRADVSGAYRVALKVSAIDASGLGFSRTAETIIYAGVETGKETRLNVNAGGMQSVYVSAPVNLVAQEDVFGVTVNSRVWAFVSTPSGVAAPNIVNATSKSAQFIPVSAGVYTLSYTATGVNTETLQPVSASSQVIINVLIEPGKETRLDIEAGAPQSVVAATPVSLIGQEDVFGVTVQSRLWTLLSAPATSTATIVNAANANAQIIPVIPGVYVLRYTVTGANNVTLQTLSDTSDTTVLVSTANQDIVVNGGAPLTGAIGAPQLITGTAVANNGATITSSAWAMDVKPATSVALLINSAPNQAQVIPDVSGVYVLSFRVDGNTLYGEPIVKYAYTIMLVP